MADGRLDETELATLDADLARMEGLWLMGAPAAPAAGRAWRAMVGDAPDADEAELRLLALGAAYAQTARRPAPPPDLAPRPDLPDLALPPIPDAARPAFRRLTARFNRDAEAFRRLLEAIAELGYAAPAADWTPQPNQTWTPTLYEPWRRWAVRDAPTAPLGADSWDGFTWSERLVALERMRKADPAAARELVAARWATEPADRRLRLLEVLAIDLSARDAEFLAGLEKDRSPKVRRRAAQLVKRAQPGPGAPAHDAEAGADAEDEAARELAAFYVCAPRNWLDRTRRITRGAMLDRSQTRRRGELFATVSLAAFAAALEMSEAELLGAWSFGADAQADDQLAEMAARSARPETAEAFFQVLLRQRHIVESALPALARRAGDAARDPLLRAALSHPVTGFACLERIADGRVRIAEPDALWSTNAVDELRGRIQQLRSGDPEKRGAVSDAQLEAELLSLAMIATPSAAAGLLDRFAETGLHEADPKLDPLRLIAALGPENPE